MRVRKTILTEFDQKSIKPMGGNQRASTGKNEKVTEISPC